MSRAKSTEANRRTMRSLTSAESQITGTELKFLKIRANKEESTWATKRPHENDEALNVY